MNLIEAAKSALLVTAMATGAVPTLAQTQAAMSERDTGPKHLIITYHCPPATRAAFREFMTREGMRNFATWKGQGVLKDYHVLFNWFVDADAWDMLSILSLGQYGDVDKWRQ